MTTEIRKPFRKHARIVIMDNDEKTLKQLIKSLSKEGYKTETLAQTSKVFEKIKNEQIDILILAVDAWGTKGYELIPMIKKMNRFLPIIATSADDSIEMATRVREEGVFFYALKPLDMKEIKLALKNAFKKSITRYYEPVTIQKKKVVHKDFEDEILDLNEASKILDVGKQTLRKLAKKGELPATRIGQKWYFIRNQLLEWLRVTAAGNQKNYGTLILETMDEGVAVVDKRLKIISCNSAYLQALDVPRDKIIGEYCYRVSHRSMVPCDESTCPVRQAFKTRRPVKFMHVNYDSDGREHYCDVIALPIKDKQGNVFQVLEVIRDSTEIYNLNEHLNWITSFFVHESRKTLGPIMMNISALVDSKLSETISVGKRNEMLLSSLCSLKLLYDMIRNYIISYKGENRTIQCLKKRLDIKNAVLLPVLEEVKPLFYKKNMDVETRISGDNVIYCDCDLMKIAFSNILNNASKYGTEGTTIQCVLTVSDKECELSILNEGIGVPRNKLDDIFDRFARFDKLEISGTGLGLHVVKMIAEMHNGIIRAESGFLIQNQPVTYNEFDSNEDLYTMKEENLKKFARFILTIPSGERGQNKGGVI
ncbi:MAG: response regulator [candidate division WOR-3 bacterium]|nr:MAG: response regulator [candidate division WOR-3 bacterium]